MTFGQRIAHYRKASGLAQNKLAKILGVTPTAVNYWEHDKREPDVDTVNKLCKILNVDGDTLLGRNTVPFSDTFTRQEIELIKQYRRLDDSGRKIVDELVSHELDRIDTIERISESLDLEPDNIIYMPFSEQATSAGSGIYLGPESMVPIKILRNEITERATFAVPVKGESMSPKFHDGDIILVKAVDELPTGSVGLFSANGCGYVKVKGETELISLNPDYDNIPITEDTRLHGEVIGVLDPSWILD